MHDDWQKNNKCFKDISLLSISANYIFSRRIKSLLSTADQVAERKGEWARVRGGDLVPTLPTYQTHCCIQLSQPRAAIC